ncbi:MAG: DNA-processing protein DprA [Pseudomonadota bacterium]
MTDLAEHLAFLRLTLTDGVGSITCRRLLQRYGRASAALQALPELSARGGRKKPLIAAPVALAEDVMAACAREGVEMLSILDADYPLLLARTDDAPPILYLKGRRDLLTRPCVAIVGARNASHHGRRMAETLAQQCGEAGYIVVSGLARGIDTAVHRGALASGTIGVVAGGPDIIYPPENAALTHSLYTAGLVVSEQPAGVQPASQHFPRRNRIISGLSQGVVVVEASLQSGSLITARLAAEQGRDVFAVPGFPGDPRAQGPLKLLRDGAVMVENADDVISVLNGPFAEMRQQTLALENPEQDTFDSTEPDADMRDQVQGMLSYTPVLVDELAAACQMSVSALQAVILEFELAGVVRRVSGNRVCLNN